MVWFCPPLQFPLFLCAWKLFFFFIKLNPGQFLCRAYIFSLGWVGVTKMQVNLLPENWIYLCTFQNVLHIHFLCQPNRWDLLVVPMAGEKESKTSQGTNTTRFSFLWFKPATLAGPCPPDTLSIHAMTFLLWCAFRCASSAVWRGLA